MRQHQDWRSPGFEFPALAEATGPFATSGFLSTIWEAWSETSGELVIAESADSLVCLEVVDDGVRPVGHRDLVDYRTPLGGMAGNLFGETLDSLPAVARLAFDSGELEQALELVVARVIHWQARAARAAAQASPL